MGKKACVTPDWPFFFLEYKMVHLMRMVTQSKKAMRHVFEVTRLCQVRHGASLVRMPVCNVNYGYLPSVLGALESIPK